LKCITYVKNVKLKCITYVKNVKLKCITYVKNVISTRNKQITKPHSNMRHILQIRSFRLDLNYLVSINIGRKYKSAISNKSPVNHSIIKKFSVPTSPNKFKQILSFVFP